MAVKSFFSSSDAPRVLGRDEFRKLNGEKIKAFGQSFTNGNYPNFKVSEKVAGFYHEVVNKNQNVGWFQKQWNPMQLVFGHGHLALVKPENFEKYNEKSSKDGLGMLHFLVFEKIQFTFLYSFLHKS